MENQKIIIVGERSKEIEVQIYELVKLHNLEIEIVHPDDAPSHTQPKPIEVFKIANDRILDSIVFNPPPTRKQRREKERSNKKNRS